MASVVRNPSNGNKYLCAVIDKSILVMEWFNPRSTFVEVKRVGCCVYFMQTRVVSIWTHFFKVINLRIRECMLVYSY